MTTFAVHPRPAIGRTTRVARLTGRRHRSGGRLPWAAVAVVSASVLVVATPASAAQGPVGLGTADSFAVLAGSGITNTGPTTITGDVGTFPTPTETGFGSVTLNGTNHRGDAVTQGAKNDLVAAYNDAAGRGPVTNVPVELGGKTLLAGVYTSPTFGLTGTLTLDAKGRTDAQFIFQAGSTLIAESNSRVLLINGADPCRVVWQVGSSATFKTGTRFVGDVLAYTSITAQTKATFQGRLLARGGAVTLDTNTITRASCAPPEGGTTSTTVATTPIATTATTVATTGTGTSGTSGTTGTAGTTGTSGSTTATSASRSPKSGARSPVVAKSLTSRPSIVSNRPFLASTGLHILGLLATGLMLLALGATALLAGQRRP